MCEARDVKGLYKKAREGSIAGFTGVSQDYEAPQSPDLIVTTEGVSIRESTNRLIDLLEEENVIPRNLRDIEVVSDLMALKDNGTCITCKHYALSIQFFYPADS